MNNAQIVRMLKHPIYRHLPTTDNNTTFKTLIRMLINFIDRRRMRGYVIAKIHHALDFRVNIEGEAVAEEAMDDVNHGLDELLKDFDRKELTWIIRLKSIVEKVMFVEGKLDVMANTWPLYFVISMFLNSYFNEIEGIVNNFFETVIA